MGYMMVVSLAHETAIDWVALTAEKMVLAAAALRVGVKAACSVAEKAVSSVVLSACVMAFSQVAVTVVSLVV